MSGRGTGGKTLGGAQKQIFTPNVNARRNKKQTADNPISRLLHADTAPEPVLPTLPAPVPKPVAQVKRQSPRLSPRQKPTSPPKAARPSAAAGPSSSLNPDAILPPTSRAESERARAESLPDEEGLDGMDLDAAPLLPPAASPAPRDDSGWLLEPDAPLVLPLKPNNRPKSRGPISSRPGSVAGSRPASRASLLDAMSDASGTQPRFPPGSAAAGLLASDAGVAQEDASLLFFQLPMQLPLSLPHAGPPAPVRGTDYLAALAGNDGGGGAARRPLPLRELPGGQLGELVVYKSGKVMLSVGDLLLDVHQGAACPFDQEIVALDETQAVPAGGTAPLCRLGKLQRRIVVTPNLDHLLQRCAHEEGDERKEGKGPAAPLSAPNSARKRPA